MQRDAVYLVCVARIFPSDATRYTFAHIYSCMHTSVEKKLFGTHEEPARVLDRFCLSEVLSSFFYITVRELTAGAIQIIRQIKLLSSKHAFVTIVILHRAQWKRQGSVSVRRTGAGISYASGYNSEIPKSMDIYCRSDQTKKKERKKKEREEVNERVTKYIGTGYVAVC